jgi:hypothetical protein
MIHESITRQQGEGQRRRGACTCDPERLLQLANPVVLHLNRGVVVSLMVLWSIACDRSLGKAGEFTLSTVSNSSFMFLVHESNDFLSRIM